jgi:hypothetical protein
VDGVVVDIGHPARPPTRPARYPRNRTSRADDLLPTAKPRTTERNTVTFKVSAGQPTGRARNACPSQCPSTAVTTTGQVLDIMPLKCSGAKGTRTPGLLHAMNHPGIPRPGQIQPDQAVR